jgi:hypothetical protein
MAAPNAWASASPLRPEQRPQDQPKHRQHQDQHDPDHLGDGARLALYDFDDGLDHQDQQQQPEQAATGFDRHAVLHVVRAQSSASTIEKRLMRKRGRQRLCTLLPIEFPAESRSLGC